MPVNTPVEFNEFVNCNDFEIISFGNMCDQFAMSHQQPKCQPLPSSIPSTVTRSNAILKTQGIAEKVTGKRIASFDDDFPPLTTTPYLNRGSKRLQTSPSVYGKPNRGSQSNSQPIHSEVIEFQPQFIYELESLQYYCQSNLLLREIIQGIDYQLQQISSPDNTADFSSLLMSYNSLQYSWKLLYSHQNAQCEMKIQIFRNSLDDHCNYVVHFEYFDGDQEAFESISEQIKFTLLNQEDSWECQVSIDLRSQCSLMTPSDYRPATMAAATTNAHKDQCFQLLQKISAHRGFERNYQDQLSLVDFYLDPTNINQLNQWITSIYQYLSITDQQEALFQIHQICSSSRDGKILKLLEKMNLIEALMTVFTPSVQNQSSVQVVSPADDCLDCIIPSVVQILLYFTKSEDAVRLMVKDENFINFLTTITICIPNPTPTTPMTHTSSLKWMKLVSDSQRLSEDLVKMIAIDTMEDGAILGQQQLHSFTSSSSQLMKCRCS